MATKLGVHNAMGELDRGVTDNISFPIDDALTTGVKWGKLLALKFNGTSAKWDGYDTAGEGVTFVLADNTDDSLIPVGVAYDTSKKDMYASLSTRLSEDLKFYPIGTNQENEGLVRTKDVLLDVYDDTNPNVGIYNAVRQALAGTVVIASGSLDTITGTSTSFDTEVAVGDYIYVGGYVEQVLTVDSATQITLRTDVPAAVTAGAAAYKESLIGKPLYATTSGNYTTIYPASGNVWVVGEITGSRKIRFYLYNLVGQYK